MAAIAPLVRGYVDRVARQQCPDTDPHQAATARTGSMPDRITESLDFQARSLALRSQRQQLLASNIANADTPGYVARDMNFAQALQRATATLPAARTLAATQPGHIAAAAAAAGAVGADLVYATQSQTNLDRNTVDMDRERASFADNALRYEAALRFINGQVRTLTSAITGQ